MRGNALAATTWCRRAARVVLLAGWAASGTLRADGEPHRRLALLIAEQSGLMDASSGFLGAGRAYYESRPGQARPAMVRTVATLADIRESLLDEARGTQPWGEVVIIAHGSQWVGLALPLYDAAAPPARASEIQRAIRQGEFPPLPAAVVDAATRVVLESCGVGRRPDLMALYAQLLSDGTGRWPRVASSEGLVEFHYRLTSHGHAMPVRDESPYVAELVAGEAGPSDELTHRSRLASRSSTSAAASWTGWQVMPVLLVQRVEGDVPDAMRRQPIRMATRPVIAEVLTDYGLDARRLHWTLDCVDSPEPSCTVRATGRILSLSPAGMPALSPFAAP